MADGENKWESGYYFLGAASAATVTEPILPPVMMSRNENSNFNGSGRRRMLRIDGEYPWSEELIQMELHMKKAYWHSRQIINQLQEVSDRTNMPITQENGQRIFGPPRDWIGPPPPKGCEVFVGKLPKVVFEPHLVPVFSKMGNIYEMRIMMDFSGTNRGYCFVQFQDAGAAHKAIRELNEYEILPGRTIGVTKSVDNTRLFIRGIPNYKTEQEVMDEMSRLTDGVTKVIVIPKSRAANQGFAFVEYDCHKNAAMARRILIPGNITLWGQDVAVDWAEPEAENQITNLYVRNIDSRITEMDLVNIFNEASNNGVSRIKKIENYAFIAFETHEQADAARLALDRTMIGGGKILVYWGKPSADNKAGANNKPGMNDRWDTLKKGSNIEQDQRPKRTLSGSETSRGYRDAEKSSGSSGLELSASIGPFGQQLYHLPVKRHPPHCIPSPNTSSDSYSSPGQAANYIPSPHLQPQDLAPSLGVSTGVGYIHSPIFQQIPSSPNRSSFTSQFRGMWNSNFRS